MDNGKKYFCIFGGGGARGVSYVGILQALEELEIEITGYAGSSIGSVFAVLSALGYSTQELREIFMGISTQLFRDINLDFKSVFGLSKGEAFYEWIKNLIEERFWANKNSERLAPVRFCDVDKEIIILSVNLNNSTFKEFSRHSTPEVEIAHAVRASVSMPGLFKPVLENGEIIVDGDLIKSQPLWRVSPNLRPNDARILEFRLEGSTCDEKITNTPKYINAVYNTISGFATDYIIDLYKTKDKFDYIKINSHNISILDFKMPPNTKAWLMEEGYRATMRYFKEELPLKRAVLLENYTQIRRILAKMREQLADTKYKDGYLSLCELFVHLCEQKKYIDIEIYNKIRDLKNLFVENHRPSKVFFVETSRLERKKEVVSALVEILKILNDKCLELGEGIH